MSSVSPVGSFRFILHLSIKYYLNNIIYTYFEISFRDLELLESLEQSINMIEQYKLYNDTSAITGDDGGTSQNVNVFTFETLFDIKCLVQKDDPELQRFVFCVLNL